MKKKEFDKKYPRKEFGEVEVTRVCSYETTSEHPDNFYLEKDKCHACRYDQGHSLETVVDRGWRIQLPHSCDEWIIGSVEEAQEMVENLKKAIEYAKQNP